jgi:cyclin-dependent kinase-like
VTSSQWDLFRRNPNNTGIVFNIREPMTLRTRYEGKLDEVELDFLEGLLQLDPEKRLTSSDCLKHPYLADMERSLAG